MLFATFAHTPFFEDLSHLRPDDIRTKIEALRPGSSEQKIKKIYFFGWQKQDMIRDVLQISHFSLMPSRFLETFGLSALESLSA